MGLHDGYGDVWIDRKLEDHCTFITTEEREKRLLAMAKLEEHTRKKPKTLIGSTNFYNKASDNNVIEDRKKSNEISEMKNNYKIEFVKNFDEIIEIESTDAFS